MMIVKQRLEMKNNRLIYKIYVCFSLLCILGGVPACLLFGNSSENELNDERKYFSINAKTILDSLRQGNMDVFTLIQETPEIPEKGPLIYWVQADYLLVANALQQQLLQKPITENLYDAEFSSRCSDIEAGGSFNAAHFFSYNVHEVDNEIVRDEYDTLIAPWNNAAYARQKVYSPSVKRYQTLDLENYPITAEMALQIAEQNGGRDARTEYNNSCDVTAIIQGIRGPEWYILYSGRDGVNEIIFKIYINAKTGDYK